MKTCLCDSDFYVVTSCTAHFAVSACALKCHIQGKTKLEILNESRLETQTIKRKDKRKKKTQMMNQQDIAHPEHEIKIEPRP